MKKEKGLNIVRKNVVYGVLKGFSMTVFPIVVFSWVSRIFNPEGIGKINFSNSFVQYFILLGGMGISSYGTREGAKLRNDKRALSQLVTELFLINLIATVISTGLFIAIVESVKSLERYQNILLFYGFAIPLSSLSMEWLYSSVEEYGYIAKRVTAFRIAGFLCIFIFIKEKEDIFLYAALQVAFNYGNYILNFFHAKQYISFKGLERPKLKKHIVPVITLFVMSVSMTFYSNIDITMLGMLVDEWEVGIYSAGTKAAHIILYMSNAAIVVIMPRMSFLVAEKKWEKIQEYRDKICHYIFMMIVPCTVGIIVWGKPLIRLLMGNRFMAAYPILCILSMDLILNSIRVIYDYSIFVPYEKEYFMAIVMVVAVLINIILNAILIPFWNAIGAAVASICTEILIVTVYEIYGKKQGQFLKFFQIGKSYLILGVVIMVIWTGSSLCLTEVLASLITTLFGGVIYLLFLILTKNIYFEELIKWICDSFKTFIEKWLIHIN